MEARTSGLLQGGAEAHRVWGSILSQSATGEADFIIAAASLAAPRFSLRSVRSDAVVCDAGYPKNILSDGTPGPVVFFGGMGQVLGGLQLVPDLIPGSSFFA